MNLGNWHTLDCIAKSIRLQNSIHYTSGSKILVLVFIAIKKMGKTSWTYSNLICTAGKRAPGAGQMDKWTSGSFAQVLKRVR